ncbi:hypothetical protein C6P45_000302 [Maudiozyma exigua]|uniref:Uncharacterized protein n=1 Tax=Maudiozyma exigua TaxID=34358 RepID=A0A9P6W7H8_MAUEX|nr:hypothetical protein C6P45_000302 [Kazachstania exigua]
MSNNIIPQSVNVSHALSAVIIQEMRNNLDILSKREQLNATEENLLVSYISQLNQTIIDFNNDNKDVKIDKEGVTMADIELIKGLTALYQDYLGKFNEIQQRIHKENKPVRKERRQSVNLDEGVRALHESTNQKGENTTIKNKNVPKIKDIYIADGTKKKQDNIPIEDTTIPETKEELNKKKISFDKYKKKDDSPNDTLKRSNSSDSEDSITKKIKLDTNETNSNSKIRSILKNPNDIMDSEGSEVPKRRNKKKLSIKFPEEDDLVRVYGEDLPNEGLKVTAVELKKILRPFREGEPNEKVLILGFRSRAKPLNLSNIRVKDSDISDTRNGPIKCQTATPILYRDNFKSFSKDLNKPPREPIPELNNNQDKSSPLVAQAYGRNGLLLRNDRGGIPYKRVPEVKRNTYPPRAN